VTLLLPLLIPARSRIDFAQQRDFAGRWILNEAESLLPPPRDDGARSYVPPVELTIAVDGMTVTVESWMSPQPQSGQVRRGRRDTESVVRTFVADGQAYNSVTESGDSVTNVASWTGDTLVVESERVVHFGMRRQVFGGVREYYVSGDASRLSIDEQIRDPAGGSLRVRVVYERRI
jgi:hypothetical protein